MSVLALLVSLTAPVLFAPAQIGMAELGPDGRRVLYLEAASPGSYELFGTSADGSTLPVPLNGPLVANGSVFAAAFSPDGERILYVADQDTNDVAELYGVPSAGGSPVKLHETLAAGRGVHQLGLRWFALTPDGTRVVFAVDTGVLSLDRVELFSAPLDGSSAAVHLSSPLVSGGNVTAFELSADGTRVAFVADAFVNEQFEALVAPVDGSAPPLLLSTLGGNVNRVGISPDSTRVAYAAPEVHSVPIDGSATPVPLGAQTGVYDWRFTPDAQRIVYRNESQLVNAPLDGASPGIVLATNLDFGPFELTADGTWSVFIGTDLLGSVNLYSRRLDGSTPAKRLATGGIHLFRLAPDGRRVAFSKGELAPQLKAIDVQGVEPVQLLSSGIVTAFRFVPGRERVVFTTDTFSPTQPQLFQAPASGAQPAFPLGPGRILALGGDRSKRTVSRHPAGSGSRTGVLLFAAPVVGGGEELFAQPWDGSDPPVLLSP
jgi:Tol biopolymer transport system component